MSYSFFARFAPLASLVLLGVLAFALAWPPAPLPAGAPQEDFSGERALAHIFTLAKEPHPAGTVANAKVRDYIVAAMKSYGCEVDVQKTIINGGRSLVYTENIFARLRGQSPKHPIFITAHFDSALQSRGAADDCAGVAAMLEGARALSYRPRLMNDVVFVFTSGEEKGSTVRAATDHPWVKDSVIVLGLEGRGTYGPAFMFETNPGNGNIIPELIASGAPAHASSVMFAVHDRTPNGTDFGHIKRSGGIGYNVAFVGGLGWYHTRNDRPEHVSPASLQQMGEYVLSVSKHFGAHEERMTAAPDAVYFNTLGTHLVTYPGSWSPMVSALALILAAVAVGLALFRRVISPLKLLAALVLTLVLAAAVGACTFAITYALYQSLYVYLIYNAHLYQTGFMLIAATALLLAGAWGSGRLGAVHFFAAGLILWAVAAGFLEFSIPIAERFGAGETLKAFVIPEAAFVAAWPTILAALALFSLALLPRRTALRETWILSAGTAPALLMAIPGILAMNLLGAAFSLAPLALLAVIAGLFCVPAIGFAFGPRARWAALASLLLGISVSLYGFLTNGFAPAQPKLTSLIYAYNQTAGKAAWLTTDAKPDAWTSNFLKNPVYASVENVLPGVKRSLLMDAAPVLDLPKPEITVLEDVTDGNRRKVKLRYYSPRQAPEARLTLLGPATLHRAMCDGEPLLVEGMPWDLNIEIMPDDRDVELFLEMNAGDPLRMRIEEKHFLLPDVVAMGYPEMPGWMLPKGNTLDWWEGRRGAFESGETRVVNEFDLSSAAVAAAR